MYKKNEEVGEILDRGKVQGMKSVWQQQRVSTVAARVAVNGMEGGKFDASSSPSCLWRLDEKGRPKSPIRSHCSPCEGNRLCRLFQASIIYRSTVRQISLDWQMVRPLQENYLLMGCFRQRCHQQPNPAKSTAPINRRLLLLLLLLLSLSS